MALHYCSLISYALCAGSLVHGLLYYSYLASWVARVGYHAILDAFAPDNPTLTFPQANEIGAYAWFTLPTGAIAGIVLIPVMVITSIPVLRRINYNAFYFIHITFAMVVLILVCLHASTDFYCLLPGLLLYAYDISWRLRHSLVHKVEVTIQSAGDGWYRIVLPSSNVQETIVEKGERSIAPLHTYYVNIAGISRLESHAFKAANVGTSNTPPTLLLRKGPERKKLKKRDKEWTWKLGATVDASPKQCMAMARLEGPYSPHVPGLFTADRVLALVGGTGITGALSIARWWATREGSERNGYLRLVWTIRTEDVAQLKEIEDMKRLMSKVGNMDLSIHITSKSGRLDLNKEISGMLKASTQIWVYISGPDTFSSDAEKACWDQKTGQDQGQLSWYTASYTV